MSGPGRGPGPSYSEAAWAGAAAHAKAAVVTAISPQRPIIGAAGYAPRVRGAPGGGRAVCCPLACEAQSPAPVTAGPAGLPRVTIRRDGRLESPAARRGRLRRARGRAGGVARVGPRGRERAPHHVRGRDRARARPAPRRG